MTSVADVFTVAGGVLIAFGAVVIVIGAVLLLGHLWLWASGWPDGEPVWSRSRWEEQTSDRITWRSVKKGVWRR